MDKCSTLWRTGWQLKLRSRSANAIVVFFAFRYLAVAESVALEVSETGEYFLTDLIARAGRPGPDGRGPAR